MGIAADTHDAAACRHIALDRPPRRHGLPDHLEQIDVFSLVCEGAEALLDKHGRMSLLHW